MLFPALRHEVSFWHAGSRFDGDLVLPEGAGPHPVVLVVSDAQTPDRDYSPWLDGLAVAGIASFTWDRPAVSDRSVDPCRQVVDHAREVLSAMSRLQNLPELDPVAVAVAGWGEGGWAAAQAVTFSDQFRALVLAGTPTVAPAQLIEHRVLAQVRAAGHDGEDVDAAREAVRDWLADLAEGFSRSELEESLAVHRGRPWFEDLRTAADVERPPLGALAADPLPTLSAVGVPVLALFGEQDPTLPLAESVRGVREALRAAGHVDHRVAVVQGADQALRVRPAHGHGRFVGGRHQFGEWPSGLTEVIAEWLVGRLRAPEAVPMFPPPGEVAPRPRRPRAGPVSSGRAPVRQVRRRICR